MANGLTTHSQTTYDGQGGRTVLTTAPDGTTTTQTYTNGRLISAISGNSEFPILNAQSNQYDPHGRLAMSTDGRGIVTAYTYFNDDQPQSMIVTGSDNTTQTNSYTYNSMGRLETTTLPDGGVVTQRYWQTGELKDSSGARTYPVSYTYDSQGRMKMLVAGTGTTTWNYDPTTGLLSSKQYDDGQSSKLYLHLSRTAQTRTWARGIVTTYGYNNAGELTSITYSDGAPSVATVYDRRGFKALRVFRELRGELFLLHRRPTTLRDMVGWPARWHCAEPLYDALLRQSILSASNAVSLIYQSSLDYDSASRVQTVPNSAHSAAYSYLPN